jgi:hypothetical protein
VAGVGEGVVVGVGEVVVAAVTSIAGVVTREVVVRGDDERGVDTVVSGRPDMSWLESTLAGGASFAPSSALPATARLRARTATSPTAQRARLLTTSAYP